jgi:YfiH family protein
VLAVSVADCIPLFGIDPGRAVIGVAHCGWRGIVQGIVEEFAACFAKAHAKAPLYLVGASIGRCCYEVRSDFLRCFPEHEVEAFASESAGGIRFDLKSLVASRLMKSGVGAEQISIDNTCTSCKKYILSSYRADGTKCGRMLAYLMIRD